jgi:DNA-directed RNA polymerase subunit RPC12/RpoP
MSDQHVPFGHSVYSTEAPYMCPTCRKYFASKDDRERHRFAEHDRDSKKVALSNVGDTTTGELACPKCGGTGFKAKRTAKHRAAAALTIGAATLKTGSQVRCTTCGTIYKRA